VTDVVHRLTSGDRVDVAHGSESLVVTVRYAHDPPTIVSAAHLTPAEALDLADDLRRQAEAAAGSATPEEEG